MFIVDKAPASINQALPVPKVIFFDIDDTLSRNGIMLRTTKRRLRRWPKLILNW